MTIQEAKVFLDNLKICINEHPIVADWLVEIENRKTENSSEKPNNCEPQICDICRYYNRNIPCGSTPSACKEADKFAEEFVDGLKKLKPKVEPTVSKMEQVDKDINVRSKDEPKLSEIPTSKCHYEPKADGILFKGNLKEGDYKLIKTTNGWVLEGNDIAYCGEPQTERKDK